MALSFVLSVSVMIATPEIPFFCDPFVQSSFSAFNHDHFDPVGVGIGNHCANGTFTLPNIINGTNWRILAVKEFGGFIFDFFKKANFVAVIFKRNVKTSRIIVP